MVRKTPLNDADFLRYQRQVALSEIGESGQGNLANSHVLIIGCGGLGSAAGQYLAAAGVGRLVIVDDDIVESSNLQRQVVYRESDLGKLKARAMQAQLLAINPSIKVRAIDHRLDQEQLNLEVMLADVVLDCSDNMATRQQINLACFNQSTDLITAAAIGWNGQFAVFEHSKRELTSEIACYRCIFPFEENLPANRCSDSGVMGPVVGVLGSYQALAAIQTIAMGSYALATQTLHHFDGLVMQWQQLSLVQEKACPVCRPQPISYSTHHQSAGKV